MASSPERASAFSWQVTTTQQARRVGWLLLLPLTVLLCHLSLNLFALALWSWWVWRDLWLVFLCASMFILCFLVTYLVSGYVHDYLATYQVTQDGLIKSSPLRTQQVRWEQVVKLRREVEEDVWWLMDDRGHPLLTIGWHLLPSDEVTATLKVHLFRRFQQQLENLFAEWAAKGKVFRPSLSNLLGALGAGLASLTFIALALTFWERSNLFWKAILAFYALWGILCGIRGIWGTLRLLTLRVFVQGDWLCVSELFRTPRLHLGSVTEVVPILSCPRSGRCRELEGLELKSGSVRVRISNEVRDFFLLCLYLASKLPPPWNAVVKTLAIETIWHEKRATPLSYLARSERQ